MSWLNSYTFAITLVIR